MKKVGIVSLYGDHNFGNKLQNYAVETIINDLGYEAETISALKNTQNIGIKGRLCALIGFPRRIALKKRFDLKRCGYIKKFSDKYLNVAVFKGFEDVKRNTDRYSFFVAGSDQLWNHWNKPVHKYKTLGSYFLDFAPARKRVCISPSFGFNEVPEEYRELYTNSLKGFKHLSCREEKGCEIIKELTGRDAVLLCDPTMALTSEQWDRVAKKPDYDIPPKYILTYFIGGMTEDAEKYIKELSGKTGAPVIKLIDLSQTKHYFTAPDEFLYLIKNCDHLCTDSFHGCVFSILYRKTFTVFGRKDNKHMHSRTDTLLKKFGLEQRAYGHIGHDTPCIYTDTENILQAEREKMKNYLRTAFADTEQEENSV